MVSAMNYFREKTQQILKAMEFANIDRLDELQELLEQHAEAAPPKGPVGARVGERDFGDDRIIDFLFARRTALRASGQGG